MKKIFKMYYNAFIAVLVILKVSGREWADKRSLFVIDGMKASLGQFPFMASIMRKAEYGQKCGGSVLNHWFVLTACHCVTVRKGQDYEPYELSWLLIVAGHVNRYPGKGGQIRYIDIAIVHKKCMFKFPGTSHDLALLKVNQMFRWTPWLKPAPIFSKDKETMRKRIEHLIETNAKCFGIGWGMTKVTDQGLYGVPAVVLRFALLRLVRFEDCASLLPHELKERRQICAVGYNNSNVCKADSGGPLYCQGHVYGVVSWGPFCGEYNMATMFQRIDTDSSLLPYDITDYEI